ncbi:unnamed protein product, partial [Heterotrigona itama]
DTAVAHVARSTLENAVRQKIRREPTEVDIAGYLSGSLEGELALPSSSRVTFWFKRLGNRWMWSEVRNELSLECLARGGRRVIIPLAAKRQVIGCLRAAVSEHHMSVLLRKPDQGKVFDATSRMERAIASCGQLYTLHSAFINNRLNSLELTPRNPPASSFLLLLKCRPITATMTLAPSAIGKLRNSVKGWRIAGPRNLVPSPAIVKLFFLCTCPMGSTECASL